MKQQPLVGQGLLITEALRSRSDTKSTLQEWSARHQDFYPTTHNTHNRQTSTPPAGFESSIPGTDRRQTQALDRTATWIGVVLCYSYNYLLFIFETQRNTPWQNFARKVLLNYFNFTVIITLAKRQR